MRCFTIDKSKHLGAQTRGLVRLCKLDGAIELLRKGFNQIHEFASFAYRAWCDPRVPLLARILVLLLPMYWINPGDLIPDIQPGGICDDLVVSLLLAWAVYKLTPQEVFQDARRATCKAVTPTVCGICCLSLFGLGLSLGGIAGSAKQIITRSQLFKAKTDAFNVDHACESANFVVSPAATAEVSQPVARAARMSANKNQSRQIKCLNNQMRFERKLDLETYYVCFERFHSLPMLVTAPATEHSWPDAYLYLRGGQRQLYASEDSSAPDAARNLVPFQSAAALAGGIFVGSIASSVFTTTFGPNAAALRK